MEHRRLLEGDAPYSIFRLPQALTCWQAVAVMGVSYLAAALLGMLSMLSLQLTFLLAVPLGLLALIVLLAGTSGAGVCLTDLARGRPYRSLLGYCIAGLLSLPKLLGAGLLLLLLYLAVLLGVALVLLLCKLPGIGPVLLVLAVPLLVLVVALALLGNYVAASIVGPAIWDGERVLHALGITWAITRQYPFAAIGKIIGGLLLSSIFAGLLLGLIGVASAVVGGLAASIIGTRMELDWNVLRYGLGGYGAGGHWVGAGIGYALVFATASAFVFLLPLMVGVLTWCEFSTQVDLGSIRSSADKTLSEVGSKMAEMKEKAQTAPMPAAVPTPTPMPAPAPTPAPAPAQADAPAAPASSAAPANRPPAPPAALHCPRCAGAVQPQDRFCEHCGQAL